MTSGSGEEVVLALGSNLGDRMEHLRTGARSLAAVLEVAGVSSVYESRARGLPEEDAPDFLNAVLRGRTTLGPEELLEACHTIEEAAGRSRKRLTGSRTLDLDVVFYADRVEPGPGLILPHPRWMERGFVLGPLLEVAPRWRDPMTGRSVEEICEERAHLLSDARRVASGEALGPW